MDLFNKKTMTQVVSKLNPATSKVFAQFLPVKNVATKQTMWDIVHASNGIADFRAEDAEAQLVEREAYDQAFADLADIAEKERFNDTDLRTLREAGSLPISEDGPGLIQAMAAEAELKQRQAMQRLRTRVDNRLEWMRVNALMGSIAYNSKGLKFTVDYGIPTAQKDQAPAVPWSTLASAKPLEDIQGWQVFLRNTYGREAKTMICSYQTMLYIAQNTAIQAAMQYTMPMMTVTDAVNFVQSKLNLTVVLYDSTYQDSNKVYQRYMPENKVILIPDLSDLPEGLGDTAVTGHAHNNYQPGYYTWTEQKADPYGVFVGVGIEAFPRLMHPEVLYTVNAW